MASFYSLPFSKVYSYWMAASSRWLNINSFVSLYFGVNECQIQKYPHSSCDLQPLLHIWWRYSKCWRHKWCCIFDSDIITILQQYFYSESDRRFSHLSWSENHIHYFPIECFFIWSKPLKEYLERTIYIIGICYFCVVYPWNKSLDGQHL